MGGNIAGIAGRCKRVNKFLGVQVHGRRSTDEALRWERRHDSEKGFFKILNIQRSMFNTQGVSNSETYLNIEH
jgi:hypothetical protein